MANPLALGSGQSLLHVESEEQGSMVWWLVNGLGQEVSKGKAATGRFEIDLRDLPAGTYYLRMQSKKYSGSEKVILLRD